jgi:hypothetical protein
MKVAVDDLWPSFEECSEPKTDVSDCQWLQSLHSVGLLRASFRLSGVICAIRSLLRHRNSLIQVAAEHVLQDWFRFPSRPS